MHLTLARLAFLSSLALAAPLVAQTGSTPAAAPPTQAPAVAVDRSPWLYKGSDLDQDPAWRFGTLPNGLRYAIRRNAVPPGQVAVRVRIDAGSLMERDSERGYAHLIEHLAFRGSRYVPDGEAIRVWQRLGATFGSDSNALTSPTQTVYRLDLPAATPEGLAESMKLLSGMMAAPNLDAAALAAERPVVLAERREQPGPQQRIGDATRSLFFAGQPLADRSPIGTVEMLEAATPESVGAFHARWYRPERTVIVISGDLEPAVMEQALIQHWASWRGVGAAVPAPDFGKPDPSAPRTATLVEPALPPMITFATVRPWQYNDDTRIFNQRRIVDLTAIRLLNRRLEQRARAGGSFLVAGADLDDVSRSVNGTFVQIQPIGDDWAAALRDVRVAIAALTRDPPTEAEVAREVADIDAALKQAVDTAAVEPGSKQADDLVQAVDIREVVTAPATSYALLQDMRAKRMFTPAAIQASARRVFTGDAMRALVVTPTPEQSAEAALVTALDTDVSSLIEARRASASVSFDQLPSLGRPGQVASRATVTQLGVERIGFANGTNLLLWPNDSESGRVYVRVRFGGGRQALPADRETPAWAGDLALVQSGIGRMDVNDLEALTSGRRIGMSFGTTDDAFELSATTSAADLSDQLRLFATKLAHPNWDANPVQRAKAGTLAGLSSYDSSPDGVLARDLARLLRAGDPRWGVPQREAVSALTPQQFRAFWEPQLKAGPIEVIVSGDVQRDAALQAVAASFGALAPRAAAPAVTPAARFPVHRPTAEVRYHDGAETQAAAVIAWPTGGGTAGIAQGRRLEALTALFSDRLLTRLRSQEGASYTPQAANDWPVGMPGGGQIMAFALIAPDRTDLFFRLAREIAADLVARPVDRDELQRVMAPLSQRLSRASTGNMFWIREISGGTRDPARLAAVDTIVEDFLNVTPEDLQALAQQYLVPTRDWSLVVLPRPAAPQPTPND